MADPESLKKGRTSQKAKVTSAANKLRSTINSNNHDLTQAALESLHQAYEEFCIIDLEYCELVESKPDEYHIYETVGNLNLTEYSEKVLEIYNDAISSVSESSNKPMENTCVLAISNIRRFIDELSAMSTDFDYNIACKLLEKAKNCLTECKSTLNEYTSLADKGLFLELGSYITDLEFSILKVELLVSKPNSAVAVEHREALQENTSASRISEHSEQIDGRTSSGGAHVPNFAADGADAPRRLTDSGVRFSLAPKHNDSSQNTFDHAQLLNSTSYNSLPNQSCTGRKYKQAPIPSFDGDRSKWGEFKSIWNRYANTEYQHESDKAYALSLALKGKAKSLVKSIRSDQANAHQRMLDRLDKVYSDVSHSLQYCYNHLKSLKAVKEGDYTSLVDFVGEVESVYSQLSDINQLSAITMFQIDEVSDFLPHTIEREWLKAYSKLDEQNKVHPFSAFMEFLDNERDVAFRKSERKSLKPDRSSKYVKTFQSQSQQCFKYAPSSDTKQYFCVVHKHNQTHSTASCRNFISMTRDGKLESLRKAKCCFRCFDNHFRSDCKVNDSCSICRCTNHHVLLCKDKDQSNKCSKTSKPLSSDGKSVKTTASSNVTTDCNTVKDVTHTAHSIYPISEVQAPDTQHMAMVFFDGGSSSSYITHAAAKRIHARKLENFVLDVTTMGGNRTQYKTCQYEICLKDTDGHLHKVLAYGMNEITGPVEPLNMKALQELFPNRRVEELERRSSEVDILLGNDHCGLHPEYILLTAGDHLRLLQGKLGCTIQGTHPRLGETTSMILHIDVSSISNITQVWDDKSSVNSQYEVKTVATQSKLARGEERVDQFILGEELGTEINPKCGGCKCSKCPLVGHSYSFMEQQELDLIRRNLTYDKDNKRWITTYPWIRDPQTLPDNYFSALATLRNTEKTLKKDSTWAKIYSEQIEDMVQRQVARKLTKTEIEQWMGPKFYISHLAVKNPKSSSTPVRIVFNSSQVFQGVSLNSYLAKGPDSYLNNLMGILLRWREGSVAMVADIRKMYNSIFIEEIEQHTHRFLWRDLQNRDPDIYVILRVNMGDRPAGAISTEALYKTAELVQDKYPEVATLLRTSTYVDDIVSSTPSIESALELAADTNNVLDQAGFKTKSWLFSGEKDTRINLETPTPDNTSSENITRVLGIAWETVSDKMVFKVSLNFSKKKGGFYTEPNIRVTEIPSSIPAMLTRRKVLEQVMKVYDPLGFLSPFLLSAKQNLRETWTQNLKWDDVLPDALQKKWVTFFTHLVNISKLSYERCIQPKDPDGDPDLVIFCDGSDLAYGTAAFVRWKRQDGSFWSRLVFAKNRISPLKRISTPQMELNGAVLAKRAGKIIEREMRLKFKQVIYLTDSEIILSMLNKLSTRFRVYEGVRIGEIQAACKGKMDEWHWVDGKQNIADYTTRPKIPRDIDSDTQWINGPEFLSLPIDQWPIKKNNELNVVDALPGEKSLATKIHVSVKPIIEFGRFSSLQKLLWTMAKVLGSLKARSWKGGADENITPEILISARKILIKNVQDTMEELSTESKGRYKQLKPVSNNEGLWCIGARLSSYNPFTKDPSDNLQYLLPSDHIYTRLAMTQAHIESGHRGRDSTLARFRQLYWTPGGSKLANAVKRDCQKCKLRDPQLIQQEMAKLPTDRLQPSPPFNKVMLDYLGPFNVRGEVQKRISGKVWAVCFTDLVSRAVHIEPVYGYNTQDFIMALTRYACIRGWPDTIYSDPGSQIVGAERELTEAWSRMKKEEVLKSSTVKGTTWKFGAADSPWRQGAVESLIKSVKRSIRFSLDNRRVSPSEFNTICYQIANIMNERPLGILPSSDSIINLLTPNSLLLGRSLAENPGNLYQCKSYRYSLVNDVTQAFWKRWQELYVPSIIKQGKWFKESKNLAPGDIVIVSDSNVLKGKYTIAIVQQVFPDKHGKVRTVSLEYRNFKAGEKVSEYHGSCSSRTITRSVQRLALLVPVQG